MISPPSKSWALNTLALMKSGCSAKSSTNFSKETLVRPPAALIFISLAGTWQISHAVAAFKEACIMGFSGESLDLQLSMGLPD